MKLESIFVRAFEGVVVVLQAENFAIVGNTDDQGASIGIAECRNTFKNYLLHFLVDFSSMEIPPQG